MPVLTTGPDRDGGRSHQTLLASPPLLNPPQFRPAGSRRERAQSTRDAGPGRRSEGTSGIGASVPKSDPRPRSSRLVSSLQ